jgi:hypothetical protein
MEVKRGRERRLRKLLGDLKDRNRILSFEGGSSRSHCVKGSFWRRL